MSDKDVLELQSRVSALESLVIDLLALMDDAHPDLLRDRLAHAPQMSAGPDGRHRPLKDAAAIRRTRLLAPALGPEFGQALAPVTPSSD